MDTQLRSQLEKFISERNQLSAKNAARDIEVCSQHSTQQPITWQCQLLMAVMPSLALLLVKEPCCLTS